MANTVPAPCTTTSKLLIDELALKLKEQEFFWRKHDSVMLMLAVRAYLGIDPASADRHLRVKSMLLKLSQVPQPKCAPLHVLSPDGTTRQLNIPTHFVKSFKVVDSAVQVQTAEATMADVKAKIEETYGFLASSQLLFPQSTSDRDEDIYDFEDDLTMQECGIRPGHTLFLVIDTDRHFWMQHANLVKKHKIELIQGYKLMVAFSSQLGARAKQRTQRFLMNCRKVLSFMMEKPATQKARPLEHIERIEQMINKTLLPIFTAMRTRASQLDSQIECE